MGTTRKITDALFDWIRMAVEEFVDLRRHSRNVLPLVQLGSAWSVDIVWEAAQALLEEGKESSRRWFPFKLTK